MNVDQPISRFLYQKGSNLGPLSWVVQFPCSLADTFRSPVLESSPADDREGKEKKEKERKSINSPTLSALLKSVCATVCTVVCVCISKTVTCGLVHYVLCV